MYFAKVKIFLLALTLHSALSYGQKDTNIKTIPNITDVPLKFITQTNNKIDKYNSRLNSKTEKTLNKLAKWEEKIHGLLLKVNPQAAENLFGNNQSTFASLLKKVQEGKTIAENFQSKYDEYNDKLTTSIAYIQNKKDSINNKWVKPLNEANQKLSKLDDNIKNSEALKDFIVERKKQLFNQSIQYIGNSKYLQKIAKENYYYFETLKNYKEIFKSQQKAEQAALNILNKVPAFTKFVEKNGILAKMLGLQNDNSLTTNTNLAGLQTRASVSALLQNQVAAGGPNAQQVIQQNIQQSQSSLANLKDRMLKTGSTSSSQDVDIPNFKPQENKSKTFKQRLEINANFQTTKGTSYIPTASDIGLSVGYKTTNNLVIGVGMSYKIGLGEDISHIHLTSNGVGFRSFIDYKLKKQFWLSGGAEMNYFNRFTNISALQNIDIWQTSALLGLSKKYKINKKMKGNMQILYDFLYLKSFPSRQPIVFRLGYGI